MPLERKTFANRLVSAKVLLDWFASWICCILQAFKVYAEAIQPSTITYFHSQYSWMIKMYTELDQVNEPTLYHRTYMATIECLVFRVDHYHQSNQGYAVCIKWLLLLYCSILSLTLTLLPQVKVFKRFLYWMIFFTHTTPVVCVCLLT